MTTSTPLNSLEHPITKAGGLRFILPPSLEVLDEFSELSTSGDLGMTVHGNYRCGKSTLMRGIIAQFQSNRLMVPFYSFQESGSLKRPRGQSATGMARLARQLRTSCTGKLPVSAESEVEALCNVAVVEAERAGTSRILLLVDEAQYLSDEQLTGLKGVTESLIARKLSPFVLLFGQPEVIALAKRLLDEETSLHDRFFLRMVRMRGLDPREFRQVLANFDKERWPEEGGPTYTQFWLPDFCGEGKKMADLCTSFQSSFSQVCRDYHREATDIPVKYLVYAACRTLKLGAAHLARGKSFAEIIEDSVRKSGIVESFAAGDLEDHAEKSTRRSRARQSA